MLLKKLAKRFIEIQEIKDNRVSAPTLFVTNQVSFLTAILLTSLLSPKSFIVTDQKSICKSFLCLILRYKIIYLKQFFTGNNKEKIPNKTSHFVFVCGINHLSNQKKIFELCSNTNIIYIQSILIQKSPKGKKSKLQALIFAAEKITDDSSKRQTIDFLVTDLSFHSCLIRKSLTLQLIQKIRSRSIFKTIIEDATGAKDSYFSFFLKTLLLSEIIGSQIKAEKRIGILLPNTNISAIVFFLCQFLHTTPCILNYTAGIKKLRNCLSISDANLVITSRTFVEKANLQSQIRELKENHQIIYLEEIKTRVSLVKKIIAILAFIRILILPKSSENSKFNEEGCILFTTGSEGAPKGVILTQSNLLSNYRQIQHMLERKASDKVLNVLPFFHSFGLMAGLLLPLLSGTRSYQYPNPLHAKEIVKICREKEISILWGTPTFLKNYAESAKKTDFQRLEYVVSGAERLPDKIRQLWLKKFSIEILEGYGATEASPVISVNTRFLNKIGTAGKILPSIEYKLKPVEGITDAKELLVKGPNIMKGYVETKQKLPQDEEHSSTIVNELENNPSALSNGWYSTGDLVKIDGNNFVTIVGRRKRFAKLGGEMVSLTEIEGLAKQIWSDSDHAAISVNDNDNLETVVLFTTRKKPDKKDFMEKAKETNSSNLIIPKKIKYINEIPLFGSGKTDYQQLVEIINKQTENAGQ